MRAEKQLYLDELKDKIEESNGFIVTKYAKLNADLTRNLRRRLAEVDGEYEVVRKRVFLKAAKECGADLANIELEGHVGVVFAKQDIPRLAKAAIQFNKENEDALKVLGGFVEKEICRAEYIQALATLPSLQEMRAQFVGTIEAVPAQTLQVLQAALASILYCCEEKCKKQQ